MTTVTTLQNKSVTRYRAIFISDLHLGFRGCQADRLLDFLRSTESEFLYLAGDIFDGWEMKKRPYWPPEHQEVVKLILHKAANGTQVIYTPGNHDECARDFCGHSFDNILVRDTAIHTTANDKKLLVLHGDQFDTVVKISPWLAHIGASMYGKLLLLNRLVNAARKLLGKPYWSLAAHLKNRVKNVVSYIGRFEEAVINSTRSQNLDGVVCGHIHHAEITHFGDTLYCNTGDWVESCTALIEKPNGELAILRWADALQGHDTRSDQAALPKAA